VRITGSCSSPVKQIYFPDRWSSTCICTTDTGRSWSPRPRSRRGTRHRRVCFGRWRTSSDDDGSGAKRLHWPWFFSETWVTQKLPYRLDRYIGKRLTVTQERPASKEREFVRRRRVSRLKTGLARVRRVDGHAPDRAALETSVDVERPRRGKLQQFRMRRVTLRTRRANHIIRHRCRGVYQFVCDRDMTDPFVTLIEGIGTRSHALVRF
jgi:hypothetical protein